MKKFYPLIALLSFCSILVAHEGITEATAYRKNSDFQWNLAVAALETVPFEKTDAVLDVGCGHGKIADLVAEKVPEGKVIGLDISEKMILDASTHYKRDNLSFMVGSAAEIPFKAHFDKVISFNALHWVLEQEKALKSIYECLKDGGTALLLVPGQSPSNLGTVGENLARSEKWAPYFPSFPRQRVYYPAHEYQALLKGAGFKILNFQVLETYASHSDRAALRAWISPLANFVALLPEPLQSEFLEEILDVILLHNPPKPDGTIQMRIPMYSIIAQK